MTNADTSTQIIDLSNKLISVRSTADNPNEMNKVLEISKKALGKDFYIEEFEKNKILSLLIRNTIKRPKKFRIILNAHLDVVPGNDIQFSPYIKKGRIYGRGAYDMKAAAAAMILLYKNIAKELNYPIGLQLTTDEETGGMNGTKHQIDKGVRADFVITGEGTNLRTIHQSKGMLMLKLTASGKTSHSAYPWLGENAIIKLNKAINDILNIYPLPLEETHETTVTVTHIGTRSSSEHTVTPDHCEALLDIRFVPKDRHTIIPSLQSLISKDIKAEIMHASPVHNTQSNNEYIKLLEHASHHAVGHKIILANAHGTSDVRHFAEVDCDGVEFGPIGGGHHYQDEWVDTESLGKYYQIMKEFLLNLN